MTDEGKADIKSQIVSWAAGQPFNNVLLAAILGCMLWGTYFAMTTALPQHLKQIQDGYRELSDLHREERKELRETYDQWMQRAGAKESNTPSVVGRHD